MDIDSKMNMFDSLVNNYVEVINYLIDISLRNDILPLQIVMTIPFLREYIEKNRIVLLEHGILHILPNKEYILNFSMEKLEELDKLDDEFDDNVTRKKCFNKISDVKTGLDIKGVQDNQILNLLIEIKNNSKKLDKENIELIKNYINILVMILEEIKKLF